MPICPKCHSEYRPGVTHCTDDGTELVDNLPADDMTSVTLEEVYATVSSVEAERIRGLLEAESIACYVRVLRSRAFPTAIGADSTSRIAVPRYQIERAVELIKQARADGVVSSDGNLLG
ncbi:MAG: DUF2007 domain-containing protein [Deltaproteobacteria bacterium]|nr:DUF2007 domain-containing protein [Deltaproteobacteria bacterium]